MAVDVETQAEVLNALGDFWQKMEADFAEVLTEEDIKESQAWINSVRSIAGLVVDGSDPLGLGE